MKGIQIRETKKQDFNDIMEVERQAFGQEDEAELVRMLLDDKSAEPVISLLAFCNNKAAGHILFTKAAIEGFEDSHLAYILAPLAVKPEFQKRGIGGKLIKEGIERLKEMTAEVIFVLGHPDYYSRFGFTPDAASLGYAAPYPIPAEHANAWMVRNISSKDLGEVKGKVVCANSLNKEEYWRE